MKQKAQFVVTAQKLTVDLGHLSLFLMGIKTYPHQFIKADAGEARRKCWGGGNDKISKKEF